MFFAVRALDSLHGNLTTFHLLDTATCKKRNMDPMNLKKRFPYDNKPEAGEHGRTVKKRRSRKGQASKWPEMICRNERVIHLF